MEHPLPSYKDFFKQDIVQNIKKKTLDFRRNIFMPDLIDEAVYYAADMCLEFYSKSGHILPQNWVDHIINETCTAFKELFNEFDEFSCADVHEKVNMMMANKSSARRAIDDYYAAVNNRYNAACGM